MRYFKQARKYLVAAPVLAAGSAFAAVPADVTAAIGDFKTDASTVAGVILVAIVVVAGIKFIRKGL